jgi:carbon-monoxide dehydrogenase large subunit
MKEFNILGKDRLILDGKEKVTGEAKYCADISLPNMLYGGFVRSKYPHARIVNINKEKAERLYGVKAIITGDDISEKRFGFAIRDQSLLAYKKVRFVGEPVVAVAAIDKDILREALELIEIEYEELPPVFDPEEAIKDDSPLVHEELLNYELDIPQWNPKRYGNVCFEISHQIGDVEEGFKKADLVFEDRFSTHMVHPSYMEPKAVIASFDISGRVTVYASTLGPFQDQLFISKVFGLPFSKIRVIAPKVGGSFGGKMIAPLVLPGVLLAKITSKPVKIVLRREEEFIGGAPRHPVISEYRTGVTKDGRIVARDIKLIYDTGAYADWGPGITSHGFTFASGPYNIPNLRIDALCVYTNKVFTGSMSGWGNPQVAFAYESQMDIIAEKLGMDPLELRFKNLIKKGDRLITGQEITTDGLRECIERVKRESNWDDKKGLKVKNKGIGIGCMVYSSGYLSSSAIIKLNEDGGVTLLTGVTDVGGGSPTGLAMIVSEELGIDMEDIAIVTSDTDTTPYDYGTIGSRVTFTIGNAVKKAAIDVKSKLLNMAGELLEANVDDLEINNKRVYVKGMPERGLYIAELAAMSIYIKGGPIIGTGSFYPDVKPVMIEGFPFFSNPSLVYAAHVAEVEVDRETGKVKVINFIAAHDVGFAINPVNVKKQIEGMINKGIGYALSEEMIIEQGRIKNPSFWGYKLIKAPDMPEVKPIIVEAYEDKGPYGAKGVGEPGLVAVAPAIANAIYDATGLSIKNLPITPKKILNLSVI